MEIPKLRFLLLIGSIIFSIILGWFAFSQEQCKWIIQYFGYWFVFITFGIFVYFSVIVVRKRFQKHDFSKNDIWALLGILIVGIIISSHEKMDYKILMDELVLSANSLQMHWEKEYLTPMIGHDINGTFTIFAGYVDKRPLFFPFCLSVVHDLTGYRPDNVFYLNFFLYLILLGLTYLLGKKINGVTGGFMASLLLLSIPLLTQISNGGSFEILNLVMIMVTVLLAINYYQSPDNPTLIALSYSGALLSQVRYESAFFLLPIVGLFFLKSAQQKKYQLPILILVLPLLLIIRPIQHKISFDQLDREVDIFTSIISTRQVETLFSFDYFGNNIAHAIYFFFNWSYAHQNSLFLSFFGIVFGISIIIALRNKNYRNKLDWSVLTPMIFFGTTIIFITAFLFCYFWSQFDDPISARMSLVVYLLFIFPGIFIIGKVINKKRITVTVFMLTTLSIIAQTIPALNNYAPSDQYIRNQSINWKRDFLRNSINEKFLMIDDSSLLWTCYLKPSLTFARFKKVKAGLKFHMDADTFQNIYVYQELTRDIYGTLKPYPEYSLPDTVELEIISERMFRPFNIGRISRIKSFNTDSNLYDEFWSSSKGLTEKEIISKFEELWISQLP